MKIYGIFQVDYGSNDVLFVFNDKKKADKALKELKRAVSKCENQYETITSFSNIWKENNPKPEWPVKPNLCTEPVPGIKAFLNYRLYLIIYKQASNTYNDRLKTWESILNAEIDKKFPRSEYMPKKYEKYFANTNRIDFCSSEFEIKEIELEE